MNIMKVYYDNFGRIKDVYKPPIYATSKKADKIEVYTDFDNRNYIVSITLKRADGVLLGPYPMNPKLTEDGKTYHEYTFDRDDTDVPGTLQMSIRYEILQEDPYTGELMPVLSKPVGMVETYIYEAIESKNDKLSLVLNKVNQLENQVDVIEDILSNLDSGGNITISHEEPGDKTKGKLWGKII